MNFFFISESKQGIVIIDSPGVGESKEMDDMVIQYLPEAFAFIYVVNIADAGAVKDRVSTWIYLVWVPSDSLHGSNSKLRILHVYSNSSIYISKNGTVILEEKT